MNYDLILLRYGELSLKSTYVRTYFESILIKNITKALTQENIGYKITRERGRIYLSTTETSKSCSVLKRIFGIVSFSPAIQTTSILENISKVALQLTKNILTKEKSFAIRSTRVGAHAFSSKDVAVQIGNDIVKETNATVNLNKPNIKLYIEIRGKKSFLFTEKIPGVGGLPLGTQGRILALIENPYSLLAAWYLMHRGCNILIVNTLKTNEKNLYSFLKRWYVTTEMISVDLETKNFFNQLRALITEKNCDALVTGQTFEDPISAIKIMIKQKKEFNIPIFTPLISMTKKEIEQQCKKRGISI